MNEIEATAASLIDARRSGRRVPARPIADAATAYAVQALVADAMGWFAGATPRHWKSGGASRDAVLTHAPLPPQGVGASPATAGDWPFHDRGIEAEVALRLGVPVDAARAASLDHAGALALVDALCVAIEVVDSRWVEALKAPDLARLADLQVHGALVLGAWQPFAPRDWAAQTCHVRIGDAPARAFQGTHPLGDPAFVLPAWLRHATRDGAVLPAGSVVTTGTWCGLLPAQAGDLVSVAFEGLGDVSVQF
jgi:2-keto-4-pentenoate hydratase